jgi:lysophospholipase L1-like esterase
MPFGDSITYGVGSTPPALPLNSIGGGYRIELSRAGWAHSQLFTFVGFETSGPATLDGHAFARTSEGLSGYTIDDAPSVGRIGILPLAKFFVQYHTPDIILLNIGTNDLISDNDVAHAPARLGQVIDIIAGADSRVLIVLAKVTPEPNYDPGNAKVIAYNAALGPLVAAKAGQGVHIILVDMFAAFTANSSYASQYFSDGLHPNDAGYSVMAATWYAAIGGLLPH